MRTVERQGPFEFKVSGEDMTEQAAIDAIVASQKAAGDPIDPNGARKFVRALVALGLFEPVGEG